MNRIHRVVFNRSLGLFQAVSEHARGRGKCKAMACAGACALAMAASPSGHAQEIIGGGSHEVVDGLDPAGDSSGTRPSPWEIAGELRVGDDDTGSVGALTIRNGGVVVNIDGRVGLLSSGAVTVTGESSSWSNRDLYVGDTGQGTLSVLGGASVAASGGISVGTNRADARGEVEVSGADSSLVSADRLLLGHAGGEGALTVEDGGLVSASRVYMGGHPDTGLPGTGSLLLAGSEGQRGVLATGFIEVGAGSGSIEFDGGILRANGAEANFLRNFNAGDVTFAAGGAFIDSNGHDIGIGAELSGPGGLTKLGLGALTLSGQNSYGGSTLIEGGTIKAGAAGAVQGDYVIGAGGTLDIAAQSVTLTSLAGEGAVLFAPSGAPALTIEQAGATEFSGTFSVNHLFPVSLITLNKQGAGTLTLTGDSSLAFPPSSYGLFSVGVTDGTLAIEGGGSLRYGGSTTIGGGESTLRVAGTGTRWHSGALILGHGGPGSLSIQDGAEARTKTFAFIGSNAEGSVSLSNGATWQQDGSLTIGQGTATGRLVLESGSALTTSAALSTLGADAGALGEVLVSDAHWLMTGKIMLGNQGKARLEIRDGGVVEVGRNTSRENGSMGYGADAEGRVSVEGAGSRWHTATLAIGHEGLGVLDISNGGMVESRSTFVGDAGTGEGTVTLRGGDTRWNTWDLTIGRQGKGKVVLADGGTLDTAFSGIILAEAGGSKGTLQIGDGGLPGNLVMFSPGPVVFGAGDGTLSFNHIDDGYVFNSRLVSTSDGRGTIVHQSGGTTLSADNSGFTGTTRVAGGTMLIEHALGGSVTVGNGAALGGSGVAGSGSGSVVMVDGGGALTPGGDAIGAFTVNGDLVLSPDAILDYQLGAPAAADDPALGRSDRVAVTGDLTLDGTLDLAQSGDAADGAAGLGYYRLMTYSGGLIDNGLEVGRVPQANASLYEIQAGSGHVDLFVPASGTPGDDTLQHWQGGDGSWGAGVAQWLNQGGDVPAAWAGNHAVFKNQPGGFDGGVITVAGAQSFKGLQFVDEGYRLQGAGALQVHADGAEIRVLADRAEIATEIGGAGGIAKTGAGTLVLSGANTYAGGTAISDGMLSVSSDASLGDAQGALAFDGGVLQVAGSAFGDTGRDIVWGARGGGFDIADASHEFRLDQSIAGRGDLVKRGAGTLTLAGRNAYGNTRVEQGRLQGDAASISGNIANAGVVAFIQHDDARFAGAITGVGAANGRMIKDGAGLLSLEGRSTLDWTVAGGGLAIEAARFEGNVRLDGAATGLTFTDTDDAVYGGTISGTGTIALDGEGVLRLTGDSSAFAGAAEVRRGTLLVGDGGSGALGGTLDVLSGATLGGSGTIGAGPGSTVTLASGGTLSPGNSIGTLTVDGDLVFEAGSRLAIEVDPEGSGSDRVVVTGNATLDGGSVAHIGAAGQYGLRSTYTILSADGTLSGRFDQVSSDFAFLTPGLLYDYGAGTVHLELARNDSGFASAASTRNQKATAEGIESIGLAAGHAVYDAIVQLPADETLIRASFDALSGEIHASAKSALLEEGRHIRNAAGDRLRSAFAAPGASAAPVSASGSGGAPESVAAGHGGPVVWSQAFGSWGSTDSDGNAASLDRDTGGLLIGADRSVGGWRVGMLAGYSHSEVKARDRASKAKSDNYHLGLYGGRQWNALGLRTGLAYTWHHIDTERSVSLPGLNDSPRAGYRAGTFQAFGELGYGIDAGAARLEPYVNLAHVRLHTDGYGERGGAAALSGRGEDTDVTFTTLGLRAERALSLGAAQAVLRGAVGWRHALGDTTPEAPHGFSAGDAFTVAGVPIARNSAVIEAGVDLSLAPGATLGLSYAGQLAGSARDHGVKAELMVRF